MRSILALVLLTLLIAADAGAYDTDMKTCAVTNTSSECVPANAFRARIELRNAGGTNVAYCSTRCPATTGNSFALPVNGANPWVETLGDLARLPICCITAASTTTVTWREAAHPGHLTAPTPTPVPTPAPTPTP